MSLDPCTSEMLPIQTKVNILTIAVIDIILIVTDQQIIDPGLSIYFALKTHKCKDLSLSCGCLGLYGLGAPWQTVYNGLF